MILACLLLLLAAAPASAQYGWVMNPANGHYYRFADHLPWLEAEAQAVQWGGHLATIDDRNEELWLRAEFGTQEALWIGFNDIRMEGTWEWSSGESATYTNWAAGEPNDWGTGEDAAIINWEGGDSWNDQDTMYGYRGIVERNTSPNCSFSITPTSQSFDASGGGGTVTMTATPGCDWIIENIPDWIIGQDAPEHGSGIGLYLVAPNPSTMPRTATVILSGVAFSVSQAGITSPPPPTSSAFVPDYVPIDPSNYCRRNLRWTFGRTGQFTSEILGSVVVPYKSGSLTGLRFTGELDHGARVGISNDGTVVRWGISVDYPDGSIYYGSTDCSLTSFPAGLSLSLIVDGTVEQLANLYMVKPDFTACELGDLGDTVLWHVRDVRVLEGIYRDSIIMWTIEPGSPYVPVDFQGQDSRLGIHVPTAVETLGYAVKRFMVFGVSAFVIAYGDIDISSGKLTQMYELESVSCEQEGQINPAPSITALSVGRMPAGNTAFDLTINGSGFVPGSTVRWNGAGRATTFLGSMQLRAVIPAADLASSGTASVTVFSPAPGGGVSNFLALAVSNPAPSVRCLNPISVLAGGPEFSVIVYGSSFVPSSAVQWNGSNRATTFVSSTELRASISASDIVSTGTAAVTVSNPAPGGGISGSVSLSIITLAPGAPTITSISPDTVPAGGEGFTLTVNGTGFVTNSVVQFNGQDRATTFVSSTQLTAGITAEDIATGFTYGITVVNPTSNKLRNEYVNGAVNATQGTGSNTGVVTVLNPVPVLAALTPSSARAGSSAFTITAEGAKFVSASTLRWDGVDRATVFASDTRLGGTILAGDVATEGTGAASTSVSSPGPGGGISNSLTFTIRTKQAAATALYYPRLVSNATETTGIAVANLSGTDGTLTLWAFDKAGSEVKAPEVTNPVSVTIKGVEQLPILDWQLFGPGLTAKSPVGWAKVESTAPKTVGFFLTFDNALSTMDGADVSSRTLTSFVLPEVEDEGFTQIHVANPDTAAADIRFELYKSDGTLRGEGVTRKVNSSGTVAESLNDLFPNAALDGSGYIRASSTKGVVPFEYLGKVGKYVEGLNGQDADAGATVLYSPQYVVGGGYRTTLSVVNLESVAGTVRLELVGDDGTLLAPAKTAAIAARGKLYITDPKYFLDPGSNLVQGYVKVTSSGPKLTGSVVFGDPGRERFSASLPLVSTLVSSAVFGQVASNSTYFTGIAILNPNEMESTATVDVYDRNGNLVRTTAESVGAKRRVSKLVTQYFADLVGQDIASGYIKVTVDKGVASFALFGTNDLSVLSAIPPQVVP